MTGFPYKTVLACLCCAALIFTGAWLLQRTQTSQQAFPAEWDGNPASLGLLLREETTGLYVLAVWENSPAQRAGIIPGDRLTGVNGQLCHSLTELEALLAACTPATGMTLAGQRSGQPLVLSVIPPS